MLAMDVSTVALLPARPTDPKALNNISVTAAANPKEIVFIVAPFVDLLDGSNVDDVGADV